MSIKPSPPTKLSDPPALRLTVDKDFQGEERPPAPAPRRRHALLVGSLLALALPSAVAAWYLYAVASDIYVTQTSFAVRRTGETQVSLPASLLTNGASSGRAADESYAVVAFIRSRQAMRLLDTSYGLRGQWQAQSVDWLNRLSQTAGSEDLYELYESRVQAYYDEVSGLLTLETEGFDPQTAFAMAVDLQRASEELVNQFNDRAAQDLMELTLQKIQQAEDELAGALAALTRFRIRHQSIDPAAVTEMIGTIITNLQLEAALTKAEIREISGIAEKDTPKIRELRNRLAAIEEQIEAEQARLTGEGDAAAVVQTLNEYEMLKLDEELARQTVVAAYDAHERALANLRRQQLYVVSVVPPAMEPEPTLPDRPRILLYVALGSLVTLIVGRLCYSAIRDHAL